MPQVTVTSENPVKVEATRRGFCRLFPDDTFTFCTLAVPSGVREQPLSSAETLQGAMQRVQAAMNQAPTADYWVGIEGGIEAEGHEMASFSWVVVNSPDRCGKSRSGLYYLPPQIAQLLRQGMELGEANDIVFSTSHSKRAGGAIGTLTDQVIDRTQLYEQAVILALVPFKNGVLYQTSPEARSPLG